MSMYISQNVYGYLRNELFGTTARGCARHRSTNRSRVKMRVQRAMACTRAAGSEINSGPFALTDY